MTDVLDRLGQIARSPNCPHAGWLAEVVSMIRAGVHADVALGLAHGFGAVARRRAQDEALRTLAAAVPGSMSAKARYIADQLAAHQRARRPDQRGPVAAYLSADGPVSASRIRRLLPGLAKKDIDLASSSAR